jgi:hypothetical protein
VKFSLKQLAQQVSSRGLWALSYSGRFRAIYATPSPPSDRQASPFGISVVSTLADRWVFLSLHPCLALTNESLAGPGPSLQARFAARSSAVLRPDPPP